MCFIRRLPIVLVLCALLPVAASGQTFSTWTGGGSDNNWATAGNWSNGVPANSGNTVLVFSGSTRTSPNNNLGDWNLSIGRLQFASGAASFTLGGNTFGFDPYLGSQTQQIFQNSANTQTIGVSAFSFRSGADSQINLNAGDLVISSSDMYIDMSSSATRQFYVTGTDSTRRTVRFAGNVNKAGSGNDPDMVIQGNKRALVTGSLTFGTGNDGSVFIDDGVLQFSGAGTMTGGRPVIGTTSGSGNAAVWLDTAGSTFGRQLEVRNGSSGRRTIGGLNTSGTVTFSGDFAGGTDNYDLAAATGGAAVFSGVRNFTSTLHVNRPDGATTYGGTVILSGTTNSTGGVGVYGGTLQFSDFNQLGTGYLGFEQDTGDSGTLRYTGGSTSVTKQIWSNKAAQTRAAIDVSQAGTTLTWTQSGGEFSRNLTKVGAGTLSFNGPITGAGGNVAVEAGMLILTGSNSYAGGTIVSGGTLEVSAGGGQGGSPAALGTGTVSIASGGQMKYWLSLGSTNTVANPFSLSGGTLHTTDGFNIYSGRVTLASGSSTISAQYEDTITLSGGLAGSGNVLFTQSGGTGSWAAPTYVLSGTGANTGTVRVSGSSGGGATKLQLANVNALQSATLDMAAGDTGAVEFAVAGNNTYNVGGLQGSRNVAYGSNALSIGGNNQSTTYSGGLSGSGLFTKVGSGTLTLSGTSSNSGGTTVSAGRLVGTTSSLQGAITNNAAVTFDQAASGTYSGVMAGSGSLTKLGAGTLTLSGNNSFSGGAAINVGAVALGSANALGSSGTISFNGGTLQYSASNTTDYSGRFSTAASQQYRIDTNGQSVSLGSNLTSSGGSLAKLGGGTLTLSGSNSFSGGVAIDAGTLALASAGALGTTGTISFGGGTLQYVSNNTTDYSDRFSTAAGQQYRIDTDDFYVFLAANLTSAGGSLTKFGNGFLNLTGTNTYSGGTVVAGGSLVGTPDSLQGAITNNALIMFVDGGTYAGVISGSGAMEVQNSGSLRFTAANTYTGPTLVSGGGFRLDGSIAGDLLVNAISTLSGTGTVGGNAVIGGVHSPGNSPGSQTFNGNLTYQGDENIPQVDWELIANTTASAGVNYDQIVLPTGNLDFAVPTVLALSFDSLGSSVLWSDPFWDVNRAWTIYDLSGGTTSNFSNLSVGGSLLDSLGNSLSPTARGFFTTAVVGQDVVLTFTAVPEPSTWALAFAGLGCGGWMMRRRRAVAGPRRSSLS
ncbi:MAG: autotransporter-associated beta strand repeat-containing protein [Pirellulales bacterium]